MNTFFCRLAIAVAMISCIIEPSLGETESRGLTPGETAALREPIELGKRVYLALCRYWDRPSMSWPTDRPVLLTSFPTVNVLHAVGYLNDSDMPLVRQYRVTIPPVMFKPTDPVLTMQTKFGELSLSARGEIRLQDHP